MKNKDILALSTSELRDRLKEEKSTLNKLKIKPYCFSG
jgi:ribosomal protein L29